MQLIREVEKEADHCVQTLTQSDNIKYSDLANRNIQDTALENKQRNQNFSKAQFPKGASNLKRVEQKVNKYNYVITLQFFNMK